MKSRHLILLFSLIALFPSMAGADEPGGFGPFVPTPGLEDLNPDDGGGKNLSMSAYLTAGSQPGDLVLNVMAEIKPTWHVYSVTQPAGGPKRTIITVIPSDDYVVAGEFAPFPDPHVEQSEFFKVEEEFINEETHEDIVVWSVPLRLHEGIDPNSVQVAVEVKGQVCSDTFGCIDVEEYLTASASGEITWSTGEELEGTVGEIRPPADNASIRAEISPASAKPGEELTISITVEVDESWHVYQYEDGNSDDGDVGYLPTLIVIFDQTGMYAARSTTTSPIHEIRSDLVPDLVLPSHEGATTWTAKIAVPPDFSGETYQITGLFGYQTCSDTVCLQPHAVRFAALVPLAESSGDDVLPVTFMDTELKYSDVIEASKKRADTPWPKVGATEESDADAEHSVIWYLGAAALAGLILNVMPCVLPVIGLKVMSFVQQAGENRVRVFVLNVWYATGLISVFLVLASLAVFLNFGWAEQFQSSAFNIVMVAILFTFGLSFLGVWEIPIPGFVGTGKSAELASKEGVAGAFVKGAFTTVLATPCSGPLLVPVVSWSVLQPPWLTYSVFLSMGVGMAFPYLLIGAFPALVRFLPKPGAWMDTFKQIMGFALMGALIWVYQSIAPEHVIPTMALLVGLAMACWWIGKMPIAANGKEKMLRWTSATLLAGVIGFLGFYGPAKLFYDVTSGQILAVLSGEGRAELDWQPFSPETLEKVRAEGKTVLVDFTADW